MTPIDRSNLLALAFLCVTVILVAAIIAWAVTAS
jgi:hypothetical protein